MLTLKNIVKDYVTGDNIVHALKGVSIDFRKNEFVSILGQSGCGKTTLLNIIGGLDKYTKGDLVISGKSTKDFKDRDWDAYRNHSVGFVFQSYNLIPHQSVLQNVELALTLSGVSKKERRARAKAALCEVGLGNQLKKKPSELSGGQMQRVAIARAIVNNPEIILADEPTGALDTETSIQVMEILKKIASDRLVIMVTHNPDLAKQYSTRIIRMLDGVIINDTMPLSDEERQALLPKEPEDNKKQKTQKKPSMSLFTSFGLSLKNLITKKGRTLLTSFAGSIGIIGIALIYAVSQGTTAYIDTVQEDTLSSYPLTLEAQTMDLSSVMETFIGTATANGQHEKDAVYQKSMVYDMLNALNSAETSENDLAAFKKYLEEEYNKEYPEGEKNLLKEAINGVKYTYDFDMMIYTKNVDGNIIRSDSEELLQEILLDGFGIDMSGLMGFSSTMGMPSSMMMGSSTVLWQEILSGDNGALINPLLDKQYDVIYGRWPSAYNEIILVVDENNELDDMALYALGLKSKEEMDALVSATINKEHVEYEQKKWSYEEICNMEFKTVLNSDCFVLDEATGKYTDLRDTSAGLKYLYDNGITLKVTGIVRPSEDAVSAMLTGSIGYTAALTEYVVNNSKDSAAVKAQLDSQTTDIFTGLPFKENAGNLSAEQKKADFLSHINSLDTKGKANIYKKMMSLPSKEQTEAAVSNMMKNMSRESIEQTLISAFASQMSVSSAEVEKYVKNFSDEEIKELFSEMAAEQYKAQYAAQVSAQMAMLPEAQLAAALDASKNGYTNEQFSQFYDEVLEFSTSSYDENMRTLGYVDLADPSSINIYASSFENKEIIEDVIAKYNEGVEELEQIKYVDYVGIMMSSITTIINAITYVLIAFVAVSLIVSSIMIGVITLISVQERTKEIGILRSIGASKRNVSSMFNAETVIIGFASGLIGVLVTYLLCIPINIILHTLTGIPNLSAQLPINVAVVLVIISTLLTLVAGIIPSRSAAKKDPVVALRTE